MDCLKNKKSLFVLVLLGSFNAVFSIYCLGINLKTLLVFIFLELLTIIALVDAYTMHIPDEFVLLALFIGLLSMIIWPNVAILERIIGIFCISIPMLLLAIIVPDAFGGGDIKLMAACGIFLGFKSEIVAIFFAILLGGIYGIYLLIKGKKEAKDHFAFGPFLCIGMAISLFYGQALFDWYFRYSLN